MKNHYVIGKSSTKDGNKLVFGKVVSITNGIVEGVQEKNSHIQKLRNGFEIPLGNVVVDLGPEPHPGKVHGFTVGHRFVGKQPHDFFGDVCYLYKAPKETRQKLNEALNLAAKIIAKAGFDAPEFSVWEVHPNDGGGKYAGYYRHSKQPEKDPIRFAIRPDKVPTSEYLYVILHEFAHYIHAQLMTGAKINAAWLRLYNTSIKPQTIKKETSSMLLEALVGGEERPSDFKSGLDEDQRNAFNWIIRQIKADHAISIKELDILFEAQYKDDIEKLWPMRTLAKKELAPIVSEYATVNVHELWAESLAFYWTKKKLPAAVTSLIEKSLSYAKTQTEK
jgi:hypothetical protein